MTTLNVLSLFAGVGGLELGFERAGMTVVGQVEIDPVCRSVLARHWPDVPRHDDVRTTPDWWHGKERPHVDLLCGGFPCQPFSTAGRRRGVADDRWGWPWMETVVRLLRPRYVVVENVAALLDDAVPRGCALDEEGRLMRFYLGTALPGWLSRIDVPLFVSRTRLAGRAALPRAVHSWSCDSGGFTELQRFGEWTITPAAYVAFVRRAVNEIGRLDWAAPMDYMCEQIVIDGGWVGPLRFAGTHLSVAEHQRRTVTNLVELRTLAADLPLIPVLQGQTLDDYHRHIDQYQAAGIDLFAEPRVGLGSVCRRSATNEIVALVVALAATGLRLHGFGIKTDGCSRYGAYLSSADSQAWSYAARKRRLRCVHGGVKQEANCPAYALAWRDRVLRAARCTQLDLFAELGEAA